MRRSTDMTNHKANDKANDRTSDRTTGTAGRNRGRLIRGAAQSSVPVLVPVFVLVCSLVLTLPRPDSWAVPEVGSEAADEVFVQDFARSEEMERMLQELRQRSPLPGEAGQEPGRPADPDFRISPTTGDVEPADREPGKAEPPARPSSSYRAKIVQRRPVELSLVDEQVFEKGAGGKSVLLSPMVTGKPVLGSSLSYAVVTEDAEDATSIPQGLYLFDEEGRQKHFLRVSDTKHLQAVYLSPDRAILAVDIGISVNHVLHLYDYSSLLELETTIRYYPDSRLIARAQHDEMERRKLVAEEARAEEQAKAEGRRYRKRTASQKAAAGSRKGARDVFETSPLAWFNGHTLVYRILDPDTARPCNYEPCGVVSIRSYSPDSEIERLLCAGTEMCDCQLIELKASTRGRDGIAQVGMQCSRNISEWRERGNKKTTATLEVPVQ